MRSKEGFTFVAVMLSVAILGIMATVGFPVWSHITLREQEKELIFRGERYALAIKNYQRAHQGAYPSSLEQLIKDVRIRYLRRLWVDPVSEQDEPDWGLIFLFGNQYVKETGEQVGTKVLKPGAKPGQTGQRPSPATKQQKKKDDRHLSKLRGPKIAKGRGAVVGVYSKVDQEALMMYKGKKNYSDWLFISDLFEVPPLFPKKGQLPQPKGQQGIPGLPSSSLPQ